MIPLRMYAVGLALMGVCLPVRARTDRHRAVEEPRLLRLQPSRAALTFEYEQESETTRRPEQATTRERTDYFEPGLQLGVDGSVYHSSLLDFNLAGEFAYQRKEYDYDGFSREGGGDSGVDRNDLQRYDVRATLLKLKPYAMNLHAARQEFNRHLDFFTREDVDSTLWSVRGGYKTTERELSYRYADTAEDITGEREYSRREKVLSLTAARRVDRGRSTELEYTMRDILHLREESTLQDGQIHELRLRDRRNLGADDRARLHSSANFSDHDTTSVPTQRFYLTERLTLQHRDDLRSTHQYRMSRRSADDTDATAHFVRSTLRHQLFKSLVSTAQAEANMSRTGGDGGDSELSQIRGGIDESYSKKIGSRSHLNLGVGYHVWQTNTDAESSEGDSSEQKVLDETVVLSKRAPTVLSRPSVSPGSIVVTDAGGTRVYEEGLDYRVVRRGAYTEIQRVIGGAIPEGGRVLVDYTSTTQASDSFWTSEAMFSLRYSLLEEWVVIQARREDLSNHGNSSSLYPTYSRTVYGVEAGPSWARSGVEVDENDSSDFPYRSVRAYENMVFGLPLASTLVLDLSNTWRDYRDEIGEEETLSLIAHVRSRLAPNLSIGLAGGYLDETRPAEQRERTTAQADAEYRYGKLEFRTGYDYNADALEREDRDEHRVWMRTKRWF